METYVFPAPGMASSYRSGAPFGGGNPFGSVNPPPKNDLEGLLTRFGVSFPEGSSVEYDPMIASIIMTNTRANQRKLYEILNKSGVADEQVQMTFQWITAPEKVVQEMERKKGEPLDGDGINKLWKSGAAKQILSQSLLTLNGVNTILETGTSPAAEEFIPPLTTNVTVTVGTNDLHMTVTLLLRPTEKRSGTEKSLFHGLTSTILMSMNEFVPVFHTTTEKGERLYLLLHGRIRHPKPPPFEKLRLIPAE